MTKSAATGLKQLVGRLREQTLEMATIRAAIDVQFTRIAQMQAELDLLPHARRRRQTLRVLLAEPPSRHSSTSLDSRWDGRERRRGQSAEELRAYLRELRVAWEANRRASRPERLPRDNDEESARVGLNVTRSPVARSLIN
jgi:hypothetical protein